MQLIVTTSGSVRCLYDETIDLTCLGRLSISRASHVEPSETGKWRADLSPVGGPCLGPFKSRNCALRAEANWLEVHWLTPKDSS